MAVKSKQHARAHGFQTAAPTVEQSIARRTVDWAENDCELAVSCLRKRYMSVGSSSSFCSCPPKCLKATDTALADVAVETVSDPQ